MDILSLATRYDAAAHPDALDQWADDQACAAAAALLEERRVADEAEQRVALAQAPRVDPDEMRLVAMERAHRTGLHVDVPTAHEEQLLESCADDDWQDGAAGTRVDELAHVIASVPTLRRAIAAGLV